MTIRFNTVFTCQHCGQQSTAESGFGRWMRNHPSLDSKQGIVRTDTDHTILRFKTSTQGREFQLLMDLEVKEFGSCPDPAQLDVQAFKHQFIMQKGKNCHGAPTVLTRKVKSRVSGRIVAVRYLGWHLLQFERTSPTDSQWIKWNHREISVSQLLGLLAMELDPFNHDRTMAELLRDRHATRPMDLFS